MVQHSGRLPCPRHRGVHSRCSSVPGEGHAHGNRRRFWGEDSGVPRACRCPAFDEDRPPGKDRDVAQGGVRRDGPHAGLLRQGQDWSHARWKDYRRPGLPGLRSGRLSRLHGSSWSNVRLRRLQHRQRPDRRLRRRREQTQHGSLPRPRRYQRRLRSRERRG